MLKKFKKQMKNEKGLTLIELLAVIVILAIVAAIAVPAIGNVINNSKDKAILADVSNVLAGAKLAVLDGSCGDQTVATITCNKDTLEKYVEGKTLTVGDQVVKSSTGWEVTYGNLKDIKNTAKFTVSGYTPPAIKITEAALNTALGK